MRALFCYLYKQWLSKFVDSKDDWLVRLIDTLSGSECKYCMGVRQWFNGLGFGLLLTDYWVCWTWVYRKRISYDARREKLVM
jgi:hypothetical protein